MSPWNSNVLIIQSENHEKRESERKQDQEGETETHRKRIIKKGRKVGKRSVGRRKID